MSLRSIVAVISGRKIDFWLASGVRLGPIMEAEMRTFLIIYLICISLPAFAGDFDNWYFKFLSVERKVKGETFAPDGKVIGGFSGINSGEASKDEKQFTEKFEYTYMPEELHVKDSLVWTKDLNGIFHSSSEFPADSKFSCELTIKDQNQYLLKTTFEDGRTCETTAQLKEDGILYAVDTAKDKDGAVVFILKYTRT